MKVIQIDGVIGWDYYASNLREELASADGSDLEINLYSPGGDAIEGLEIYSMLSDYEGHITVQLGALVASAATLIPCAADWAIAKANTIAYIHRSWVCACGDTDELSASSKLLNGIDRIIAEVYARRIGRPVDDILLDMQRGTWLMGANELIKYGIADEEKIDAEQEKQAKESQQNEMKHNAQLIINDIDTKIRSLEEVRPAAMQPNNKNKKSLVERIKAIKTRIKMPKEQIHKEQLGVDTEAQAKREQAIKQIGESPFVPDSYKQLVKDLEGSPVVLDRVNAEMAGVIIIGTEAISKRTEFVVTNTLDIIAAAGYQLDKETETAAKELQDPGKYALKKIKATQGVVTPKANACDIGGVSSARSPADTAPAGETSEGAQRWERIYSQKAESK